MPNPAYYKGRRLEYRVKAMRENIGDKVTRGAGSHGRDLICENWVDGKIRLINCSCRKPPQKILDGLRRKRMEVIECWVFKKGRQFEMVTGERRI